MKDAVKTGLFLTGTIIGAGFASGRELVSFFGGFGWWAIAACALCGALFIFGFILFMLIGKRVQPEKVEDVNAAIFGRFSFIADILVLLSLILSGATMLSGGGALFYEAFGISFKIPWVSVATCVVVYFCILTGIKGLVKINSYLMPVTMAVLLAISAITLVQNPGAQVTSGGGAALGLWAAVTYVSMNFMQSFGVIGGAAKTMDVKAIKRGSIAGGAMLCIVMAVMLSAVLSAGGDAMAAAMPSIYLALRVGGVLSVIAAAAIWLALITSLLSSAFTLSEWLNSFLKCRWLSILCVLIICLVVSMLGFSRIISIFFPIQGAIGVIYITGAAIYYFRRPKAAAVKEKSKRRRGKGVDTKTGAAV